MNNVVGDEEAEDLLLFVFTVKIITKGTYLNMIDKFLKPQLVSDGILLTIIFLQYRHHITLSELFVPLTGHDT